MMETTEKSKKSNNFDKDIRRATYQIPYPTEDSVLQHKNAYKEFEKTGTNSYESFLVHNKNIDIQYKNGTINNVSFKMCAFFIESKKEANVIEKMTFRRCYFNDCFLGSIEFKDVRFENCIFNSCDFMNSRFHECNFDRSEFSNCSAINTYFDKTEIAPNSFFKSLNHLNHNISNNHADIDDINKSLRHYKYNHFNLTKTVYRSNTSAYNSIYVDESLYHLKKAELTFLIDRFRHPNDMFECKKENFVYSLFKRGKQLIPISGKYLNIILTKGGTSLQRLIYIASVIIIIFSIYIKYFSSITYELNGVQVCLSDNIYINCLWKSLTIFFRANNSFKTCNELDLFILTLCQTIGIFWYAVLIPILLRKIYK
ncbi:MAG: pentapeptide repeat-containing protein [Chitinophagales bacterium]|nr:pentapeptide repeat-containing protein [Chitinophagales bacterium]